MFRADFRERIVRKPGQLGCDIRPSDEFERWIGERQHVLQIAEL
jgi:hypothetical protein